MKYKLESPLSVYLPRKTKKNKKIILNLNVFHNLNRFDYNNAKKQYSKIMYMQLKKITFTGPIRIKYILHRGNKTKGDRMNVLSIHDKFFCDALQDWNCLENDNDDFILDQFFETGNIDKKNPRVEILIEEM